VLAAAARSRRWTKAFKNIGGVGRRQPRSPDRPGAGQRPRQGGHRRHAARRCPDRAVHHRLPPAANAASRRASSSRLLCSNRGRRISTSSSATSAAGGRRIAACYERALKSNPALAGKLVVRFSIASAGTVVAVAVDEDTLGAPDVAGCVRGLIARWRFPPPTAAPVEVSFPFVFQAGS
jgi:hypothetical protein